MKKFLILSLALTLAVPALAEEQKCEKSAALEQKKCDKPVQDCLNGMVTELKSTGFIGVELEKGAEEGTLKVSKVISGAPAEKAGIQAGDELVALDGIKFDKKSHEQMIKVKVPGKTVTCTFRRGGAKRDVSLTLSPMPADVMARYIGEHMLEHADRAAMAQH